MKPYRLKVIADGCKVVMLPIIVILTIQVVTSQSNGISLMHGV